MGKKNTSEIYIESDIWKISLKETIQIFVLHSHQHDRDALLPVLGQWKNKTLATSNLCILNIHLSLEIEPLPDPSNEKSAQSHL